MNVIDRIRRSDFIRYVAVMSAGSAAGQLLLIAASPVITRLYTPQMLGEFAIFMAIVGCVISSVSGRYEQAMMLPKSSKQGKELLGISLYFTLFLSTIYFLLLLIVPNSVLRYIGVDVLSHYIYVVPIILATGTLVTILYFHTNRSMKYEIIAKAKAINALMMTICTLSFGVFNIGLPGLIAGHFLGSIGAVIYMIYQQKSSFDATVLNLGKKKLALIRKYKDFPLYNASSSMLDGITSNLPVFFLAFYFPESIVGFYALVVRVAKSPFSFIALGISQVNFKTVIDLLNNGQDVRRHIYKVATVLLCIFLPPSLLLWLAGQEIFQLVFGDTWRDAGSYAEILIFGIMIQAIVSPLSPTLGASNNNKLNALWKVIAFLSTFTVYLSVAPIGNIKFMLYAATANTIFLYLLYFYFILRGISRNRLK